jgi:hypothetical protein
MSIEALRPSFERQLATQLERPAGELDGAGGAWFSTTRWVQIDDVPTTIVVAGDPVCPPDVGGGDDAERQVDGVAQDVSVGGGAAVGR